MSFNYTLGSSDGSAAANKKLREHLHFDVMRIAPKKDPSYTSGNNPDSPLPVVFNAGVTLKVGINEGGADWPSDFTNETIYKHGDYHSVDFLELVVREIIVPEDMGNLALAGSLQATDQSLLDALEDGGALYLNADGEEVFRHQLTLTDIANKFFSLPNDLQYGKRYKISLNVQYAEGESEELKHLHMGYVKTDGDDKLNAVVVAHNNYKNAPDTNNKDYLVTALADYNDNWGDNWIRRFQPKPVITIDKHGDVGNGHTLSNRALVTVSEYQWQGANDIEKREIQGFLVNIDGEGWIPGEDSHLVLSEGFDSEYDAAANFFATHTDSQTYTFEEGETLKYYKAIAANASVNTGTGLANLGSAFSVGTLGVEPDETAIKGSKAAVKIKKTWRLDVEKTAGDTSLKYHSGVETDVINRINNAVGVFYTDAADDNPPGDVSASIPSWGGLKVGGASIKSNAARAFNQKANVRRYISPLDTSELIKKKLVEGTSGDSDEFTFLIAAAGSPDFFSTPINGAVVASLKNTVNQKISVAVSQGVVRNDFSDVVTIKPQDLESETQIDTIQHDFVNVKSQDRDLADNNIVVNALVPVSTSANFDHANSPNNKLPQVAIFSFPLSRDNLNLDNEDETDNLVPNDGSGDPGDIDLTNNLFNIGTPSISQTLYSHMKTKADDSTHSLRHHGILNAEQVNRVFNSVVVVNGTRGEVENGETDEGLGLKINIGDNTESNDQTFSSGDGSPLINFDYGEEDTPMPEAIAIFLITMTQIANPTSTDAGSASSDTIANVKPVILFPSRAASAATVADATDYNSWPNTFNDGFSIKVSNGQLNGANSFEQHKIQYKYEISDDNFSAWEDAVYDTAPSWDTAEYSQTTENGETTETGVTTIAFGEDNVTSGLWNTGAVFKVRVQYKSDTKDAILDSTESGKLVLTRGVTALKAHIQNNISLTFEPTQDGAVDGSFTIGHVDGFVSTSGYPDFVVSSIVANYQKTGTANLDTYGTVTTGTMSATIAKGTAFTPNVVWTIRHKNMTGLNDTVTLSAGTFYHYLTPTDIRNDLSLILMNVSTVTAGTPDENVINSSSASIGDADFIITNAKEDDGRVRIITHANALRDDTGLTLSSLVETPNADGSVTVSVNVTSPEEIYDGIKIDLITVIRDATTQFSVSNVSGWSGVLAISNTEVISYPSIFDIDDKVSAITSVYHADNFDAFADNRSHGYSVQDALSTQIIITPTIVDVATDQNLTIWGDETSISTVHYMDDIHGKGQADFEVNVDQALEPVFLEYENSSETWLQAGKVPMIRVSIKSTDGLGSVTLLGVNLGFEEQTTQSGYATFAEIEFDNENDAGEWQIIGDEEFDTGAQTLTISLAHTGYDASNDPISIGNYANFYNVIIDSSPVGIEPQFARQGAEAEVSTTIVFDYNAQHADASNVTKTEPAPSLTYYVTNISDPRQITLNWGAGRTISRDLSIPELSEIINPKLVSEVKAKITEYGELVDAENISLFDDTLLQSWVESNSSTQQQLHIAGILMSTTLGDVGIVAAAAGGYNNATLGGTWDLSLTVPANHLVTNNLMALMAAKIDNQQVINIQNILKKPKPSNLMNLRSFNIPFTTPHNNYDSLELLIIKADSGATDLTRQQNNMILYVDNDGRESLGDASIVLVYYNDVSKAVRVVTNTLGHEGQLPISMLKTDHKSYVVGNLDSAAMELKDVIGAVGASPVIVDPNASSITAQFLSSPLDSDSTIPSDTAVLLSKNSFTGQNVEEHLILGLITVNLKLLTDDEDSTTTISETYLFDTENDNDDDLNSNKMERIKLLSHVRDNSSDDNTVISNGYVLNLS